MKTDNAIQQPSQIAQQSEQQIAQISSLVEVIIENSFKYQGIDF